MTQDAFALSEEGEAGSSAAEEQSALPAASDFEAAAASYSTSAEIDDGTPSPAITSGKASPNDLSGLTSPMTEDGDAGDDEEEEDMKSKGSNGDARGASPDSGRGGNSLRSTSSKIANLRAAFEKNSPAESAVKRRFPSTERKTDTHTTDREREYWKEIARLRDERDKEHELRQAYEEKCVALDDEVERLQQGLKVQGNLEKQMVTEAATTTENLHVAKTRTDEVSTLQQQLSDLKRSISTSTRMDNQVTDSTFAQEMGVLHHELQNWIVNNFRRVKADVAPLELCSRLDGVPDLEHADLLKQICAAFEPAAKLSMYQAIAIVFLMDIFSAELLFGLPSEQEWCRDLLQAAGSLESRTSSAAYSKWRVATLDAIHQSQGFEEGVKKAAAHVAETTCSVLSKLTGSEPNVSTLQSIMKRAVSLAHVFRVQRARYDLYLPSPTDAFDPATMEDLSDGSEGLAEPAVRCATFPAVVKIGDEYGDNAHLRNVIVKAKVLCREDVEP